MVACRHGVPPIDWVSQPRQMNSSGMPCMPKPSTSVPTITTHSGWPPIPGEGSSNCSRANSTPAGTTTTRLIAVPSSSAGALRTSRTSPVARNGRRSTNRASRPTASTASTGTVRIGADCLRTATTQLPAMASGRGSSQGISGAASSNR